MNNPRFLSEFFIGKKENLMKKVQVEVRIFQGKTDGVCPNFFMKNFKCLSEPSIQNIKSQTEVQVCPDFPYEKLQVFVRTFHSKI